MLVRNASLSTKGEKSKCEIFLAVSNQETTMQQCNNARPLNLFSVLNEVHTILFQTLQVRLMENKSLNRSERVCSPSTSGEAPSNRPKSTSSSVTSSAPRSSLSRPSAPSAKSSSGTQQTETSQIHLVILHLHYHMNHYTCFFNPPQGSQQAGLPVQT